MPDETPTPGVRRTWFQTGFAPEDEDARQTVHERRRSLPTFSSVDGDREDPPAETAPAGTAPAGTAPAGTAPAGTRADETVHEGGAATPALPPRYTCLSLLGEGGMGEVWRVADAELHRTVALKVVRPQLLRSKRGLQRFKEEAQVAAQLQHPGIVPVHDIGVLPDGRLWFTMKEVRGRTLSTVLVEVHKAWRMGREAAPAGPGGGYTFRRMIDAFLRVCETVGYAHARGVVHRDLKPDNIMVGDHAEVLVLDWGLAKVLAEEAGPVEERIRGLEGHTRTRMGAVSGTPSYMPPEQARGQQHRVGPPSDVYALGATLYDLLTERPPYVHPTVDRVLDAVIAAETIPPPSTIAEGHPIDEELDRICLKALQPRPEDRYPDANALAAEVAAWLDGATKRERALQVVAEAKKKAKEAASLDRKAGILRNAAKQQVESLPPDATEDQKGAAWDLEDEAAAEERRAEDARHDAVQLLRGALTHAPDLAEAHGLLAKEYHRQHRLLEAAGKRDEARVVESLLRAHDRGQHGPYLRGEGALTLVTDVPAAVDLYRYETVRRRLEPVFVRALGVTPLREVALPMGSYLLILKAAGRVEVRYPILVGREEHWDGVRPGSAEPFPIALPRPSDLAADDVYVPAGWYWSSADHPVMSDPRPRRRLWCDAFVIQRFPVTNETYLRFLNDLVAHGREEDAEAWVPRTPPAVAGATGQRIYGREGGRFVLKRDAEGHEWQPRWPVVRVGHAAARGYAAHLATVSRRPWRLPMDLEFEKASRGVDERIYPWGNQVDPTWAQMVGSPGPASLVNVGSRSTDRSPYGVGDAAGNASSWVADPRHPSAWAEGDVVQVRGEVATQHRLRGGSWNASPFFCRVDLRKFYAAPYGNDQLGFRLARSFPADG